MTDAPVNDEASAHQALAYAMTAVGSINLGLGASQEQVLTFANPVDDILKKLEDWIKRLVAKLAEIAKQLKASFSITVGTSVSVTISCGPFS
jgi:hypothetical protein